MEWVGWPASKCPDLWTGHSPGRTTAGLRTPPPGEPQACTSGYTLQSVFGVLQMHLGCLSKARSVWSFGSLVVQLCSRYLYSTVAWRLLPYLSVDGPGSYLEWVGSWLKLRISSILISVSLTFHRSLKLWRLYLTVRPFLKYLSFGRPPLPTFRVRGLQDPWWPSPWRSGKREIPTRLCSFHDEVQVHELAYVSFGLRMRYLGQRCGVLE